MVEQVLDKKNLKRSQVQIPVREGIFLVEKKQLFAKNPGQALNYHAETCSSDIFN